MKIAIVGAQEYNWNKDQKEKAKAMIKAIFIRVVLSKDLTMKNLEQILYLPIDEFDFEDIVMISGHCPLGGVDIWAEDIADELGIKKEIYPPEVYQWNDKISKGSYVDDVVELKGYRSRNIQIAEMCDILYCINPKGIRSGGTWTMEYAKKLGKEVHLVEIE